MNEKLIPLISLHKHWLNADAVKEVVNSPIKEGHGLPEELAKFAELQTSFAKLSVVYGLIYVVIEGYKELKCTDADIDELLAEAEFVDALRLFRNATFHFQKNPIPEKVMKFLDMPESEKWIRSLHRAFKMYFERNLPISEWLDQIKS